MSGMGKVPDEAVLRRSHHLGDSIQVAITATPLSTPVRLPPGLYQLFCETVALRWKQAGSWCKFATTAPATPTVSPQGVTGATTYGYRVVAVMPDGSTYDVLGPNTGRTARSAEGTTATGNAALSASNFNRVSWSAYGGAAYYEVYRTTGGATQGLIATNITGTQFDDTGIAGTVGSAAGGPTAATGVGHRLPAGTYWGDVRVNELGEAYFNAYTDTGSATLEFIPITEGV